MRSSLCWPAGFGALGRLGGGCRLGIGSGSMVVLVKPGTAVTLMAAGREQRFNPCRAWLIRPEPADALAGC